MYVEHKLATLEGMRLPPESASFFSCDLNIDPLGATCKRYQRVLSSSLPLHTHSHTHAHTMVVSLLIV